MTKISSSPDRFSFQKEKYLERCQKNGVAPNQHYLEMYDETIKDHKHKWDNPESRIHSMEYDLLTTDWILEKVRNSRAYAQNLYAAMCNNDFTKKEIWPVLKKQTWSCSWRYAGGIIADMRQEGDYIDWYCSGIRDSDEPNKEEWDSWSQEQQTLWKECSKYVGEGVVTQEIGADLDRLGWVVQPDDLD